MKKNREIAVHEFSDAFLFFIIIFGYGMLLFSFSFISYEGNGISIILYFTPILHLSIRSSTGIQCWKPSKTWMTRAESHNLPWNLTFIPTLTSKSVTSILRISNFSSRSSPGQQRVNERKEQYKKVRTHVKQEDGRMHAYGWSLPANKPTASSTASTPNSEESRNANVPVPVPVYCRPLMEKEPGMKVR